MSNRWALAIGTSLLAAWMIGLVVWDVIHGNLTL